MSDQDQYTIVENDLDHVIRVELVLPRGPKLARMQVEGGPETIVCTLAGLQWRVLEVCLLESSTSTRFVGLALVEQKSGLAAEEVADGFLRTVDQMQHGALPAIVLAALGDMLSEEGESRTTNVEGEPED